MPRDSHTVTFTVTDPGSRAQQRVPLAQAEEAAVRRPAPPDSGGPAGAQEALSGRLSESVEVSVAHSSPTHGDPTDRSPPGSSVHGILQARILEWVAIFSSRGSS